MTSSLASRSYCTTTSPVTQMALTSTRNMPYYLGRGIGLALYFGKGFAIGGAGVFLNFYVDEKLTPFPRLSRQEVDELKHKDNPVVYSFASWDDLYEQLIDGRCPDEILPHVNAILDGTLESQGPAEALTAVSTAALLFISSLAVLKTFPRREHIIYNSMVIGFASYRIWKQYYRIKPVVRTRLTQSKVSPAVPLMYMRCPSHNLPPAPVTKIIRVPYRTVAFY
eukprot:TRINITY_DN2861_c1_g3::TRINITY_DN2861_c1_g3_i1::g.6305::m.6305 TRINITY_DN2861_c1_g3::TRINITY_DN2861_c1_g3_i1::g.6305  ORF type:complete len:224 (-),score=14.00 TRINITY_DN2861_c1_g3_i1:357-1028(-)